jgi:hypothetical protein
VDYRRKRLGFAKRAKAKMHGVIAVSTGLLLKRHGSPVSAQAAQNWPKVVTG